MNKFEHLVSLLPKAGIQQEVIDKEIQIFINAGEWEEAVSQSAAILNEQKEVPEEVEQALSDAAKGIVDVSQWYTWRYN